MAEMPAVELAMRIQAIWANDPPDYETSLTALLLLLQAILGRMPPGAPPAVDLLHLLIPAAIAEVRSAAESLPAAPHAQQPDRVQ